MVKFIQRIVLPLFLAILCQAIWAQTLTREQYIDKYKHLAINKMRKHGIPASITLAQGILESNSGNSTLARKANNHFGIKCHKGWTGETFDHSDDRPNECFRKYRSVEGSFEDHSLFLRGYQRYAFLFDLPPTDYAAWAKGLKKAGYATAPDYAERLVQVIEECQLAKLDTGINVDIEPPNRGRETPYGVINKNGKIQKQKQIDTGNLAYDDSRYVIDMYNARKVFVRNRIKYIKVQAGDTFESLTKELHLLPFQLYKYNELGRNTKLKVGQVLYLQPKRRRADVHHPVHVAEKGETMYKISQLYGIRLKSLYRLNRMAEGNEVEEGQMVYLRKKKKAL